MNNRIISLRGPSSIAVFFGLLAVLFLLLLRPGGIGGTGINGGEGGVGGTGINTGYIGRIDRFGSIYVNNDRIIYDDDTPITIDSQSGSTADLKIGQIVQVLAQEMPDGSKQAVSIEIRHSIIGVVETSAPGRIQIQGTSITLPAKGTAPAIGTTVAISGFTRPDGTIMASRIDPAPDMAPRLPTQLKTPFPPEVTRLSLSGYPQQIAGDMVLYGYKLGITEPAELTDRLIAVSGPVLGGKLQIKQIHQQDITPAITEFMQKPEPASTQTPPARQDAAPEPPIPAQPINTVPETPDRPQRVQQLRPETPVRPAVPKPIEKPENQTGERHTPDTDQARNDRTVNDPETNRDRAPEETNADEAANSPAPVTGRSENNQTMEPPNPEPAKDTDNQRPPQGKMAPQPDMIRPNGDKPPVMRPEATRKPVRPTRPDRIQRPERPTRPERPDRPERPARPSRPGG